MAEDEIPTTMPVISDKADYATMLLGSTQSPALQIMLNPTLYERVSAFARIMSKANGVTPKHLVGKPAACFAVITRSLTWKLDPFAVACATYETPGGVIGYEGKLCQAILENSGALDGNVRFEHYGTVRVKYKNGSEKDFKTIDPALEQALLEAGSIEVKRKEWSAVQGHFEIKESTKEGGKKSKYAVATWTDADAVGLGVRISAQIKGEKDRRTLDMDLIQCFPRNSTLWALDTKTQICYTGVRRFASVSAPGIFMGIPFDQDDAVEYQYGPDHAKDMGEAERVAPARPTREHFSEKEAAEKRAAEDAPKDFSVFDEVGVEVMSNLGPKEFLERYHTAIAKFMESGLDLKAFDTIVENNAENVARVKELGKFSEGLGYLESDIGMIRVRLQPKTEPKPTPEPEKSEPVADAQPVQDEPEDIPGDDGPAEPEIAPHAAPVVPETFTFIAANNQPYNYPTIEKWEHAVRSWCLKTGTRENRMAGKKRNQEAITNYAALGGTYAEAVDRIVLALEAE